MALRSPASEGWCLVTNATSALLGQEPMDRAHLIARSPSSRFALKSHCLLYTSGLFRVGLVRRAETEGDDLWDSEEVQHLSDFDLGIIGPQHAKAICRDMASAVLKYEANITLMTRAVHTHFGLHNLQVVLHPDTADNILQQAFATFEEHLAAEQPPRDFFLPTHLAGSG